MHRANVCHDEALAANANAAGTVRVTVANRGGALALSTAGSSASPTETTCIAVASASSFFPSDGQMVTIEAELGPAPNAKVKAALPGAAAVKPKTEQAALPPSMSSPAAGSGFVLVGPWKLRPPSRESPLGDCDFDPSTNAVRDITLAAGCGFVGGVTAVLEAYAIASKGLVRGFAELLGLW